MSWYRKYRPRRVADLHLSSVRTTLQQLLEQGWLPQSMLLAGPKGTGKTSTARILAAVLNDPANHDQVEKMFATAVASKEKTIKAKPLHEPDVDHELIKRIYSGSSLAVHELDAASHRGIDDIRQLKEQTVMPPAEGTVSVYILDEVHMLTTEAFNALLKVLEEPPAHVVFVLATTELHKLPATIVSRCTVIQFNTASVPELVASLQSIADQEGVTYDAAGLELIARKADGSFRDAVKLAEQIASQVGGLTKSLVEQRLGEVQLPVEALVAAIISRDSVAVVAAVAQLRQASPEYRASLKSIIEYLYQQLQLGLGVVPGTPELPSKVSHFLLQAFSSLPALEASPVPLLTIELKALELVFKSQQKADGGGGAVGTGGAGTSAATPRKATAATATPASASAKTEAVPTLAAVLEQEPEPEPEVHAVHITATAPPEIIPSAGANPSSVEPSLVLEKWVAINEELKRKNATLAAILNSARPLLTPHGQLQVELFYKFHRDQIMQPKFQAMFQAAVKEVAGGEIEINWVVGEALAQAQPTSTANETISAVAANLL